jgi:hypothetical protein
MSEAAHGLADGIPALPERLKLACFHVAAAVDEADRGGDVPDDLLERMKAQLDLMTNDGTLDLTLQRMTPAEAHDIAFQIAELAAILSQHGTWGTEELP